MLKVTLCVGWINYNNRQYTEWYQISLLRDTFFLPKCNVEIKLNWQNFHRPQFHFICQSINYVLSWNNNSHKILRIIEIKHFIKMVKLWDLCSFKTWMIYYFCGFINREAERQAREEVNTLKESIEVAKVKAETDTSSASMMIAK